MKPIMEMAIPDGKWEVKLGKEGGKARELIIVGDLTAMMDMVTSDKHFMQQVNMVIETIDQLEFGITAASGFSDYLEYSEYPVMSLLGGFKFSGKSQISSEGKMLIEQAAGGGLLGPALKLLAGIDIAVLFGYHEKYLGEAIMETGSVSGDRASLAGDSPASSTRRAPTSRASSSGSSSGGNSMGVKWFSVDDLRSGMDQRVAME